MSDSSSTPLFPIRVICERTGIGASTLRAWERRYGLLKPQRTPKGHRLYSEADIQLVQRILDLLNQGHSISQAAQFVNDGGDIDEISSPVIALPKSTVEPEAGQMRHWDDFQARLLQAVSDFSSERLDAVYNEASASYPIDLVSRLLVLPALEHLGTRWRIEPVGIGEEHFFSAWLRNKLGARLHHSASLATGTPLVIACVPGHRHELGALLFSLAAMGRGYRTVYLGADMPLEPIPDIVARTRAGGVVLAADEMAESDTLNTAISQLAGRLGCPLFIGGRFPAAYDKDLASANIHLLGEQFQLAVQIVTTRVLVHPAA